MAWCTSSAAVAESTPPDRPQIARASPTWARIDSTCSAMTEAGDQRSRQPAISRRKRVRISLPYGVWTTSGWNWIP
jgi:hypothetical protein